MLAFLETFGSTGDLRYLWAARDIGTWITSELSDATSDGFRIGWLPDGQGGWTSLDARSVEHNADLFAALMRLSDILAAQGESALADHFARAARSAGDFVMSMYDPQEGRFYVGTDNAGRPDRDTYVLDTQTWSLMSLGVHPDYASAIDWARPIAWAEEHFAVSFGGGTGYDFGYRVTDEADHAADGVWLEGTAQMAGAYRLLGMPDKVEQVQAWLDGLKE